MRETETSAYDRLGVAPDATERQLRVAFRRLALEHHPDRNPGDPDAERRFNRVTAAYRAALGALRGEPLWSARERRHGPPPRPSFRYECTRCGDSYAVPAECPRCERMLHDSATGKPAEPPPEDPRVTELIALLLRPRVPSRLAPLEPHVPALLCAAFVAGSLLALAWGPPVVAAELGLFATFIGAKMLLENRLLARSVGGRAL